VEASKISADRLQWMRRADVPLNLTLTRLPLDGEVSVPLNILVLRLLLKVGGVCCWRHRGCWNGREVALDSQPGEGGEVGLLEVGWLAESEGGRGSEASV
jgi:hypothetical protein